LHDLRPSRLHLAIARPAGPIRELLPQVPRTGRYTHVPQRARIRPGHPIPGRPAEIPTPDLPPVHPPAGRQQSLQLTAVPGPIIRVLPGQAHQATAVRVTVTPAPAGRVHRVTAVRVHRATAVRAVPVPAGQAHRATAVRVHLPVQVIPGPAAVLLRPLAVPEALPTVREAIPDLHTAALPIQVREEEGKPVRAA